MMKVAYLINSTIGTNGANSSFLQTLKGLISKGINPVVITPDRGEFIEELKSVGVVPYVVNNRPATYPNGLDSWRDYVLFVPRLLARIVLNYYATYRVAKILRKEAPDIIHTNVGILDIGYRVSRSLNIPHLLHIREYADVLGYYYFPCQKLFYRRLRSPRSYSVCITKSVQEHYHLEDNPSSCVIYDAVSDQRMEFPAEGERKYFFYAGRILPVKGLDILVKAYAEYVKKSSVVYPLKIAGTVANDAYHRDILTFICENRLEKDVEFLGARSDIENLMKGAKATVIPSLTEGFGRVMPEAMLNGCPVIVYDVDGSHEQLENGRELEGTDIAFGYSTLEELVSQLCKVAEMTDEELRPMCLHAFHCVNTLYTTGTHISQIMSLYNKIVSQQ